MTDPPPTTDNGYRYYPLLGPRAIRLIMLHGSVTENAPLCCEIVDTDLEDPGEYSALSYTWGGESPSLPMTVMPGNNKHISGDDPSPSQVLLLTPNCAAALRILRRRIGGTGRGIWVDAVCINQADHSEKNGQVGLMAEIYQAAGDVVVWLGGEFAPRDTRTIRFLSMGWLKWVREVKPQGHFLKKRLIAPFWEWAPYWNRAWTVQEAAHAGAVLLCKDSGVIEIEAVFDAVWTYCEGRRVPGFNFVMHQNLYEGARRLAGDTRFGVWGFGRWDVANVAAKGASDPRDRVFALRSVYPEFGMVDVDYGRDVGGVFAEATRRMVEKNMEVLFEAAGMDNTLGMPSWGVDWASERGHDGFWTYGWLKGLAAGGSEARCRFDDDGRLYLTGVVVGRVHERFASEVIPSFSGEISNTTELREVRRMDGVIYGAVSSWVYEVSAAAAEAESPSETELVDGIPASVVRLINYVATENTFHVSRRTRALLQSRLENRDGTRDIRRIVSDDIVRSLPTACYEGSRMFLTTEGRFGWAHARLEPGDLICAFAGLMYPMAVRPKGSSYVVVGPAVLDGVMDGMRWPADEDELEEWEIV
ncbi:HET domain-containing protein [Colletotrichum sojae]|uniref:HET domain-containing protein n=1 Tax=Colletotrichum sojae TaxID=2175907 RepID=A0A8H6J1D7_9PEZI|nr:HET domain-containing protein [Colletotrichum sojae]